MITLDIQIKMILFSFIYGILMYFVYIFIKKLLLKSIFVSIIFGIMNGIGYFIILKKINNGILNINLLFYFLFGFLCVKYFLKKYK